MYKTRTFTIPISTLISQNTREDNQLSQFLDRKLTLSSNSLHFLQRHNFDLGKAMTVGVPYLSREERRLVREQLWQDGICKRLDLVSLNAFDVSFCEGLRTEVRRWLCTDLPMVCSYVEVLSRELTDEFFQGAILEIPEPRGLNLDKSTVVLVGRIIADEFPQCRCWRPTQGSAMNITLRDVDKDVEV